ncbi:MAG: S-methyl-5-thioribose-1-phosphate isomerase [Oscillospiraceae bacterium]|nr:S-methyl-5-thioribose-1-phosphate isomerase [Oscillospiraceae bacterium]
MSELVNVRLSDNEESVIILDQRKLPNKIEYVECRTLEDMYDAIFELKVRGAPAIGIFTAYAMYVLGCRLTYHPVEIAEKLKAARPTAVNLQWAVDRMLAANCSREECRAIHAEDVAMCTAIAEQGLSLIEYGSTVLTHCNAGPLATSRYGTGLGALILGAERGFTLKAYVCETRPLLQGARITAFELMNAGIDTTLVCDNMASSLMQSGKIDAVFVGCDRVAANGDIANKIGTSGLAVLAKHYGVPFYVFAPSSTIDSSCKCGADIVIEERDGGEITDLYFAESIAPSGVKCFNPSFDVTPAALITAIVTEKGTFVPNGAGI